MTSKLELIPRNLTKKKILTIFFFSVFLLPETLGVPMLTTIEEAEEFFADPETFKNKNNESEIRKSSLSSSAKKFSLQNETIEF